jgi:hypothetical protein
MRFAMQIQFGIAMAAQKTLFAAKMKIGEFSQTCDLLCEPGSAIAVPQLLPKRIQRVDKDAVLVLHCLYTGDGTRMCGSVRHIPSQSCDSKL